MKNKIILIINHQFKITISKLYPIIIQYLYLLIFLSLATHLNQIKNSNRAIIENSQLAFNVNIIYLSKSINKYKTIKRIELENFNPIFMKRFLLKYKFLFNKHDTNKKETIDHIEYLKSYGFTTKLKLSTNKVDNIKYILLNLKINPILKRVKILKQKTLLIPNHLLIKTFQKQIGLPKNYIDIDKSIKKINLWYKSRGFTWANVELIKTQKVEEVYLKVFEGEITKSQLICKHKHLLSKEQISHIEGEIRKRLGIIPGYIFNIQKLELGIFQIKQKKIINKCAYTVHKNSSGLNIIVKYNLFKNNQILFYKQQTIVDYYRPILNIYKYSLNRNNLISIFNVRKQSIYHNNKRITIIYRVKSIIQNIKKKINFRIEAFSKYCGFRYYLYPKHSSKHKIIIDMQISSNKNQTYILFLYPNLKFNNCLLGYFTLHGYHKYYKSNILDPIKTSKLLTLYNPDNYNINVTLNCFGINILLKNYLYEYIYLTEQFIKQHNRSHQNIININNYSQYNFFQNQTKNTKFVLKMSKKINRIVKQNLSIFKVQIKYNTLYLARQLKSGTLLILDSISLVPLQIRQPNLMYEKKYLSQSLYVKYQQIFILPKIIKYYYNNIFIFFAEVNYFLGRQKHKSAFQTDYKNNQNIYFQNYNINSQIFKPSFLYHAEYNISLFNYLSLYIFCNFAYNLYDTINILNFTKYILNYSLYYEINVGYGAQFNIPIKKTPVLRIEYNISNTINNFLQLRAYSRYND